MEMQDARTIADPAHGALSWKCNCAGITEKFIVIPGKLAIASATRNPEFSNNSGCRFSPAWRQNTRWFTQL